MSRPWPQPAPVLCLQAQYVTFSFVEGKTLSLHITGGSTCYSFNWQYFQEQTEKKNLLPVEFQVLLINSFLKARSNNAHSRVSVTSLHRLCIEAFQLKSHWSCLNSPCFFLHDLYFPRQPEILPLLWLDATLYDHLKLFAEVLLLFIKCLVSVFGSNKHWMQVPGNYSHSL